MLWRRISLTDRAVAALLGVVGGLYIYRPYFEAQVKTSEKPEQKEEKKEKEPEP